MLYAVHQLQQAATLPMRLAAQGLQLLFRNPLNPATHTTFGKSTAAAAEVLAYTTARRAKPSFGLTSTLIGNDTVAVREEVVLDEPFCELRHFVRDTTRNDPKLLVVAPMSGHFATLLRGTVEALLPDHEVYITDWRDARDVPLARGRFDLDDYIDYVVAFLQFLGPGAHVMAVCQPSVPVLAAVSLMATDDDPAQPKTMTLMGGPVDPAQSPTVPNVFAETHSIAWFEGNVIGVVPWPYPGTGRRVYPGFVQLSGFMAMNFDRHLDAHFRMFQHLVEGDGDSTEAHRKFYDEYLSVMDMPAEYYLQTVQTVFQEHALAHGTMQSRGRRIDPGQIRKTALLAIEGELDDISGIGQTRASIDLCTSLSDDMKAYHFQEKTGHYGIFNGRRWREEIKPRVAAHIRAHG